MVDPERRPVSRELIGLIACLVASGAVGVRWHRARAGKSTRPVTVVLLVLAGLVHVTYLHPRLAAHASGSARAPYHYVLGAKYYAELGHFGLYRMTLLAGEETGAFDVEAIPRIRHLEDYTFVPAGEALEQARRERPDRFSDARWAAFCDDVRSLAAERDTTNWNKYLQDHGYNPPPARTLLPGLLLRVLDLDSDAQVLTMLILDLVLFLGVLGLIALVCGPDPPLLIFLFVMTAWFSESQLVGNFLNALWLVALLAAMTALRSERWRTAGALLGVAAAFRVFPLLLLAGPLLLLGGAVLRRRSPGAEGRGAALGFAAAVVLLGAVGLTQGAGPSTTREFVANIGLHAEGIRWDNNKLGLRRALADLPWDHAGGRHARQRRVEAHPVLHAGAVLALLWLLAAAVGTSDRGRRWAIPLGLAAVFALLTLSRYYYLALAIFLVAGPRERDEGFTAIAAAGLLLVNAAWLLPGLLGAGRTATFSIGSKAIGLLLIALPIVLLAQAAATRSSPPRPPGADPAPHP